jgi:hypothetical protein
MSRPRKRLANANSNGLLIAGEPNSTTIAATCVEDGLYSATSRCVWFWCSQAFGSDYELRRSLSEGVIERVDRTVLRQLIQPNFSKAIVADDGIPFFDELSSHILFCFRFRASVSASNAMPSVVIRRFDLVLRDLPVTIRRELITRI